MFFCTCTPHTSRLCGNGITAEPKAMRRLWNTFLKGLAAVLPLALTVYVVFWLAKTAESVLGGPLRAWLPEGRYWPGLGLLVAFLLVLFVGVLVDAYIVRRVFRYGGVGAGAHPHRQNHLRRLQGLQPRSCRPAARPGSEASGVVALWAARS